MDDLIATFLAVTSTADEAAAKQYLEVTGGDLEYAVTLYMESNPPQTHQTTSGSAAHEDDEAIAQRMQNEVYNEPEVRAADANIHRHETLMDTFGDASQAYNPYQARPRPADIFGSGRVGIFNQRENDDENEYYHRFEELDDDDDDDEVEEEDYGDDDVMIIEDEDDEAEVEAEEDIRRPVGRRRANRSSRLNDLSFTQQRLASLFRPPFDIMEKIDLDTAKVQGRLSKKWILINIQDATEFQCQVLNRDFWSLDRIKQKVRENFIFLQYQNDLSNGYNYTNFYQTEAFPHIAILDPYTGERVLKWKDGEVPKVLDWINEVDDFLTKFSLSPTLQNPVVKHEVKFDPDTLTEDQQIEFALKQSVIENSKSAGTVEDPIDLDPEDEDEDEDVARGEDVPNTAAVAVPTSSDPFDLILPVDHSEPTTPSTRVQVRFPNGKRAIHKFDTEQDSVKTLYQWLKYLLQNSSESEFGLNINDKFTLSTVLNKSGKPLIDLLDYSIGDAGLKNASILLEKE